LWAGAGWRLGRGREGMHHGVSRDACKLAEDGGEGDEPDADDGPPVGIVTVR
jgi:hypothetical protein